MRQITFAAWLFLSLFLPACGSGVEETTQSFQTRGEVVGLRFEGKAVRVSHEEIPGFMKAMTMDIKLKDPEGGSLLKAGDKISFTLVVTVDDMYAAEIALLSPETDLRLRQKDSAQDAQPQGSRP